MIRKLSAKDITTSETSDRRHARILFGDNVTVNVLEFIEKTDVGKRLAAKSKEAGSSVVERLDVMWCIRGRRQTRYQGFQGEEED